MIPVGYIAKRVAPRPEWLAAECVRDIYSVSGCISELFDDYINCWKHNGFWFFDRFEVISAVALESGASLTGTKVFYYEVFEKQFIQERETWEPFGPEEAFRTEVTVPADRSLEGYDVVSFFARTNAECSPLSCNNIAESVPVNEHCLFPSFEEAFRAVESGAFKAGEPGPLRIFAVYSVPAPN